MRPAEIPSEAIIKAGHELLGVGRNVTGFALRQRVGGGNPNRLRQVWDEHIASQVTARTEPTVELPIEVAEEVAAVTKALTERIATLAVELNDKAVKAAERRVAEIIRAAGEERTKAERELADAAETVEELEVTLENTKDNTKELEKDLAKSREQAQAQAVELAKLRERLTASESASKAAAEQHTAALAHANKIAENARVELDRERKSAAAELATVKAKAEAEQQQHAEARKQTAQEAQLAAELLTKAKTDRDSARKEANETRDIAAKLRGQIEALESQRNELIKRLGHTP